MCERSCIAKENASLSRKGSNQKRGEWGNGEFHQDGSVSVSQDEKSKGNRVEPGWGLEVLAKTRGPQ